MTGRSPLRILCADDNGLVGDVLVRLLSRAGHAPDRVRDGLEAWEKIPENLSHYDLLITDHQMPGLAGLELTQLLHEAAYPGRIIVYTSHLPEVEMVRYRRFAVASIVVKSAKPEELMRVLEVEVEK